MTNSDDEAASAFVRHMVGVADDTLARLVRLDDDLDELACALEMLAPGSGDDDELFVMAGALYRLRTYAPQAVRAIAENLRGAAQSESPRRNAAGLKLVPDGGSR